MKDLCPLFIRGVQRLLLQGKVETVPAYYAGQIDDGYSALVDRDPSRFSDSDQLPRSAERSRRSNRDLAP